jgi:hypothetical protein
MTSTTKTHKPKTPPRNKAPRKKSPAIVDHARLDPSHCLANGLFKPIFRGSRASAALNVHYTARGKSFTFNWTGSELLSIGDQSTFLAIHRLAAQVGRPVRVGITHDTPAFVAAREALDLAYDAEKLDCLTITTTANEIAATIGIKMNGNAKKRITESLTRLSKVIFGIYRVNDPESVCWQSNLISVSLLDGKTIIGINPMLSKALLASPSTFIDMREQRALKSDISKRLHVWLSSWFGANRILEERRIELDLLIPHVWGDACTGNIRSQRRSSLQAAIAEMNQLAGWTCTIDAASSVVTITRPPVQKDAPVVIVDTQT